MSHYPNTEDFGGSDTCAPALALALAPAPAPAEDRFAALRGTPEPEELEEHGPEFPDGSDADRFSYLNAPTQRERRSAEDDAVIDAAKALIQENDGRTIVINQQLLVNGRTLCALADAVYARAKARGER